MSNFRSVTGGLFIAILFLGSLVAALVGVNKLTNATLGVGLIAFACYLGILTRLLQASLHNREDQ